MVPLKLSKIVFDFSYQLLLTVAQEPKFRSEMGTHVLMSVARVHQQILLRNCFFSLALLHYSFACDHDKPLLLP